MIVEDNLADAELAKEFFQETGLDVVVTIINDGQKAIELFQRMDGKSEERPDLVLLDLSIPKRSGHEVLEFVRRYDSRIKVILYTGSKSPDDFKKAKENKADSYLVKPMTMNEIDAVVKELKNILTSLAITSYSNGA